MDWVWALIGIFAGAPPWLVWGFRRFRYYLNTNKPLRRFWKPMFIGGLSIITATEEAEKDVKTQVFDFLAAGELEQLFDKLFPAQCQRYVCEDVPSGNLRGNLLLIGGPIPNQLTRSILSRSNVKYTFDSNAIIDRDSPSFRLQAVSEGGIISKDYGIITRCPNPFNPKRIAILATGCYGWGTWAAIKAISDVDNLVFFDNKGVEFYQMLVAVDVYRKMPFKPRIDKDTFAPLRGEPL